MKSKQKITKFRWENFKCTLPTSLLEQFKRSKENLNQIPRTTRTDRGSKETNSIRIKRINSKTIRKTKKRKEIAGKKEVKKEKKPFKKPAGLIGFYFQKFEKNVSVWHKIET